MPRAHKVRSKDPNSSLLLSVLLVACSHCVMANARAMCMINTPPPRRRRCALKLARAKQLKRDNRLSLIYIIYSNREFKTISLNVFSPFYSALFYVYSCGATNCTFNRVSFFSSKMILLLWISGVTPSVLCRSQQ